jgi:hypothetical protein
LVFRGLTGNLKGRPRECLARHGTGCRNPSYDKLHLQLDPLRTELAHLASMLPTRRLERLPPIEPEQLVKLEKIAESKKNP